MKLRVAFLISFILLSSADCAFAQGWRGIVPLHSTRADVERLLGPPAESVDTFSVWYKLKNESVHIRYEEGRPCGVGPTYSQWRVPKGTVVSMLVTLLPIPLSQLGIDLTDYQKRTGGHIPQDTYYINEREGVSIRVSQEEVQDISYYPGSRDDSLACAGLRTRPEQDCEGLAPPKFDSYGAKQLEFEKSLLDNLGIALLDDQTRIGFIIAYAGIRARPGQAIAWAQRAKKYLTTVRHIPATRIKALDGGYRESAELDMFIVKGRQCAPIPSPTVDPRDVKIIGTGKGKRNPQRLRMHAPRRSNLLLHCSETGISVS